MIEKERLKKILFFLWEVEKLKLVERIIYLSDKKRLENTAEHTWHLALFLVLIYKDLWVEFDLGKTLKMILIHDLPEIDVWDIFTWDEKEKIEKHNKERIAAKRIFAILPKDLAKEYYELYIEYEKGQTVEAKIAKWLDKLQYFIQYNCWWWLENYKYIRPTEDTKNYATPHTNHNQIMTQMLEILIEWVKKIRWEK